MEAAIGRTGAVAAVSSEAVVAFAVAAAANVEPVDATVAHACWSSLILHHRRQLHSNSPPAMSYSSPHDRSSCAPQSRPRPHSRTQQIQIPSVGQCLCHIRFGS